MRLAAARWAALLVLIGSSAAVACGGENQETSQPRQNNPYPPREIIGPSQAPAPPPDMPGKGRGSLPSTKGKP